MIKSFDWRESNKSFTWLCAVCMIRNSSKDIMCSNCKIDRNWHCPRCKFHNFGFGKCNICMNNRMQTCLLCSDQLYLPKACTKCICEFCKKPKTTSADCWWCKNQVKTSEIEAKLNAPKPTSILTPAIIDPSLNPINGWEALEEHIDKRNKQLRVAMDTAT